ncbi:GNAT family N-acetyltransferase [Myroides sp. WP-1]|uniref:GNAT family N-acetyltransferase n=1 Tax=Myroides sp. WP-1 TaxID=2759944 RepID=UPI0015FDE500|nr:GNAT family protein [Myroides sp. WP-1]MBB1138011.1 GNAT family N-acetyltransferase [Myroides sp. WP-1]
MKISYTDQLDTLLELPFLQEEERELGELLLAVGRGEATWANVLVQIETMEVLSVVYIHLIKALGTYFNDDVTTLDREVQLRLWVVLLHKMGKCWSTYREVEGDEKTEKNETSVNNDFEKKKVEKNTWFILLGSVIAASEEIDNLQTFNLIQEGMKLEIQMIIGMLTPQKRTVFAPEHQWETNALVFRKINQGDHALLQQYFTPSIGQYLSIDSFSHPVLVKAYIEQSQEEMKQGTCLVLLAFERDSNRFVGCLTINDIHLFSVEIGVWVSEEQQGKGWGSALLEQAITLIETSIPTQQIIYTVEKENDKSITLCKKKGFEFDRELILEPTPLKNKYRSMLRFTKKVIAASRG